MHKEDKPKIYFNQGKFHFKGEKLNENGLIYHVKFYRVT